jgi:predicted nucleotidyltransferase
MEINLQNFTELFEKIVSPESKKIIESLYIFGSLARGEIIQAGSDIDSVLVLHNKDEVNFSEISQLAGDLVELDKKLGVEIDHVLCTQDDLFELLSPTLIVNLHADGVNIFGDDLKQRFADYINGCSKHQMLNSFLRTDMFRRQNLRKKFIKLDFKNTKNIDDKSIIGVCKEVILQARDLLYFEKDILVTPKRDICSYFLANYTGRDEFINIPMLSYNIRYGIVKLQDNEARYNYLKKAFDFMEEASILMQNRYKNLTGKTTLDLRPF